MDKFVMLDLESYGNRINPALAQLSAVEFTLEGGVGATQFNVFILKEGQQEIGLDFNAATMQWWSEQSVEAQNAVFGSLEKETLKDALFMFSNYIKDLRADGNNVFLWGNGIRADNVWLLSAYKALGMEDPIKYNEDLDYRTLHYLSKKKTGVNYRDREFIGIQHNAIDDCKFQIECACEMWKALNN